MLLSPTNIHLLIGVATQEESDVIEKVLAEKIDLSDSLIQLSWYWPIKITFSEPVSIRRPIRRIISKPDESGWSTVGTRTYNTGIEHIFKSGFFKGESGCVCYCIKRGSNHGWVLAISKIASYELVIKRGRYATN